MRVTACFLFAVGLGVPVMGTPSEAPLTIHVTPGACVTPCTVRLTVRVLPHETNRRVTILAESIDLYRSSTRPIDGLDGPNLHELLLNELPPGRYEVRVLLDRSDESHEHELSHFNVDDGI